MTNEDNIHRRSRVLMVAYACSPEHGSDLGVGWNRAIQSAKQFDTWVLCEQHKFGPVIRRYLQTHGPIAGLHFEFVPEEPAAWLMWRIPGMGWLSYNLWQRRALRVARRLHEQVQFDLAHQVTVISFREPGYLWKLGIPFVWGPVGGTHAYPWRFLGEAGVVHGLFEFLRNVASGIQLRHSPRVRRAGHEAAAVIAANSTIQKDLAPIHGATPIWLPEIGISETAAAPRTQRSPGDPLRILWSGELCARKALPLLIKALAGLPDDLPYQLRVLGKGRLGGRWQRLARRTGVERHTQWMGHVPRREALQQRSWADVFVFSSLRDTTGTVVLEALAAGLPVVCLDHQGVHDVVTDQCGIKVPVTTPREVVRGLTEALLSLAHDRTRLEQLSVGALQRAQQYLWSRQGEQIASVYRDVLRSRDSAAEEPYDARPPQDLEEEPASCSQSVPEDELQSPVAASQSILPAEALRQRQLIGRIHDFKRRLAIGALTPLASLGGLLSNRGDGSFSILMYHRVTPHCPGISPPTCNVTPPRFRRQMEGLLKRDYRAWPLRKALDHASRGLPIPRKTFVVTFDDGYESVYQNAWPVLRELDIPATIFLPTAYLDSQDPFPFDCWMADGSRSAPPESWRSLSTAQCSELLESGLFELGSHTHTHQDFRNRPEAMYQDVLTSLDVLRERFGLQDATFALPYGLWQSDGTGQSLDAVARRAGVLCCLTTVEEPVPPGSDPFGWGRIGAEQSDTAATLAVRMEGWYGFARHAWQRLRRPQAASHIGPQAEQIPVRTEPV